MKSITKMIIPVFGLILLCIPFLFPEQGADNTQTKPEVTAQPSSSDEGDIQVPPPPFSEDIFPCSECHGEMEPNPQRRVLEDAHDDIVLKHDEKNRWCLDCHDMKNRDKLHLADGRLLDFTESFKLCGQCHGPKLRDWKAGVHGRRTGSWKGQKKYLLCAHCHDPHAPKFKKLKPDPAPVRPENLR
jgi:hypothetical protein